MTGLVVFAHGSRVEAANEGVRAVTAQVRSRSGLALAETAYLELGIPDLSGAINLLVARGADRIVVVPFFLTLGIHLQRDLPAIVADLRSRYPAVRIEVTEGLEGHPALADAVLSRVKDCINGGSRSEGETY